MATAIQFRRGTTAQHANFTGLVGEITVDTDLDTIRVHDGSTAGGSRLAKYSEISALGSGDITNVIAGSGITGGAESGNATIAIDYENLSGNLVPSANNTYSLGSLTNVWKDVYVGPGSLYVNGSKVLEDNAGTIQFTADTNQNISILTTGSGDLELTAGGDIQLKSNVVLSSGKTITASGGLKLSSNINMDSNNINNVDDPVEAQDAATKAYVDATIRTDSEMRALITVTDNGGDGLLSYNNSTGVITYTGPSASEVRAHFSAGTGVALSSGEISIGQAVGTADAVTFGAVTIAGNLIVNGTTTTVNSNTVNIGDNVLVLNSDESGTPSQNGGIEIERGTELNKLFVWDEGADKWSVDGETMVAGTFEGDLTGDVTGNVTGTVSSLANHDTDDVAEGSTNLYYTDTRVRNAISAGDDLSYNSSTGVISFTERTDAEVRGLVSAGGDLSYNSSTGVMSFTERTDAEVRGLISATGDISYNSTTGVISFTNDAGDIESVAAGNGLTGGGTTGAVTLNVAGGYGITVNADDIEVANADVRGLVSAGGDLSYNSSTGVMSFTERTDAEVRGLVSASGDLSYNSSTGAFSFTERTDAEVRGLVSATDAGGDGSFAYNSSTGAFTYTGPGQSEANTRIQAHVSGGTGISFSAGGVITTTDSEIVHDDLSGFDANEHVDHSAVSITAGSYLTGGGDITTTRTLNVDATTTATASKVVARDASGDVFANLFQGTATAAQYADLAEKYATDAELEAGTVVCFGGDAEVTACDHEADHRVAGVISTDPAYMMNSGAEGQYVALTGRVPCKVVGPVAKGDLLVSSSVKGHAKADNNAAPGRIIGKAIGSSDSGEAVIEVLVNMM